MSAGYGFTGPALELGALVIDDDGTPTPRPDAKVRIPLAMLNRHGLVAGATGSGKTRTLQVMAEQLSANGVPVFLADIEGDLSGIAVPGTPSDRLTARTAGIGQDWAPAAVVAASPLQARYGVEVDRESAYEMLSARLGPGRVVPAEPDPQTPPSPPPGDGLPGPGQAWDDLPAGGAPARSPAPRGGGAASRRREPGPSSPVAEVLASPAVASSLRSAGTVLGREITRGLSGTARRRR